MKVLNKKRDALTERSVYIGRPSAWGNPFEIGPDGTRTAVIKKFEQYARIKLTQEPNWLDQLRGCDLVCWCAPQRCHGEIIAKLLGETVER